MRIDWFTVGAQALNFLILVWLMKRFLYHPVLDAIDAREKRIADQLSEADRKETEAQAERDEFQRKNAEFEQQRNELLGKTIDEAKAERVRLLNQARAEAEALGKQRHEALNREQQSLNNEITRRTRHEVFAIARKALTDLADAGLEERIGVVFMRRLRALEGDTRARVEKMLTTSSGPALIRSTFNLPEETRAAIQQTLTELFHADIRLRFESTPGLVGGIELTANGQKVAWSIDNYLASMEKEIGELFQAQATSIPRQS